MDGSTFGLQKVCARPDMEYLETLECQCIEHDEDYECLSRTLRGGNSPKKGECTDGVIQGLPFGPDDPFYNSNKIQECHERCLRLDAGTKSFYVSEVDYSCGCATGYCKLGSDQNYQVYDIAIPFGPSCDEVDGYFLGFDTGLYTEPFVATNDISIRPKNPITCNIESYLHIGEIVDSGQCECPLYDFKLAYGDTTNYIYMGFETYKQAWVDTYMDYVQLQRFDTSGASDKVEACKQACNNYPDCTEISVDTNTDNLCFGMITNNYFYNNIPVQDYEIRKISDRRCRMGDVNTFTQLGNSPHQFPTKEECVENWRAIKKDLDDDIWTRQPLFVYGESGTTTTECWVWNLADQIDVGPYNDNHMDPNMNADDLFGGMCSSAVSPDEVRTVDAPWGETSAVPKGTKWPTYEIRMEASYSYDSVEFTHRYKKQLLNEEVNQYCPTGEVKEYNLTETHEDANPHYCMQKCREKLLTTDSTFILARGDIIDGKFSCYCSLTFDDTCNLNGPSAFPQFKVYKHPGAFTTDERLMSARDPQVGKTTQCKCQGYYIFKGKAISCPANTFKNSGHCTSSCTACPVGQFSEIGSTLCSRCPSGKVRTGDVCVGCGVGKFASAFDTECQTCPLGTFNTRVNQKECEGCPAGWADSDSAEGINCNMCAIGKDTQGLTGRSQCFDCRMGFYNDNQGQAQCTACGSGRFSTAVGATTHTVCAGCGAGKYNDETGLYYCKNCNPGLYTSQTARYTCGYCPRGKYQNEQGKTSCKNCAAGRYAFQTIGSASCSACNSGQYQQYTGSENCKACSPGQYSNSGSTSCTNCPHGYWADQYYTSSCKSCPSENPGGVFQYSKSSWSYAWPGDRKTKDKSCDSYFNWAESNRNTYYWSKNSGGDWNFDCANFMSLNRGGGMRTRRPCWTGDSNNCNTFACNIWGDCSNIWFRDYVGGGSTKIWCYPGGTLASYGWYGSEQIEDL